MKKALAQVQTAIHAFPVVAGLLLAAAASAQEPPFILTQPEDQIVDPGSNVTFSVTADGTPPLSYQWQQGGEVLPGETNTTLVLPNVQPIDAGTYSVVVSNDFGWAISRGASLIVLGPPTILAQPQDTSVVRGSNAVLFVSAVGAVPLTYQWQFNGRELPGETNNFLTITNAQEIHAGRYWVVLSNSYSVVTSAEAVLTVLDYVEDRVQFQINTLAVTGSAVREHSQLTGSDRGGIAVSSTSVFVTGNGDPWTQAGVTASFSREDLTGGTVLATGYNGLVSDLRTEQVYALAQGAVMLGQGGGTISSLLEVDGATGELTGRRINLTTAISAFWGSGLFSGYGQIVILNHFAQVYSIQVPSGIVTFLGQMNAFPAQPSSTWAFWGVAEKVNGVTSLVYVQDSETIMRRRVPDGSASPVATFPQEFGLANMASITVSPRVGRWYFHHSGWSLFRSRQDSVNQTVGFANAAFTVDTGIYPTRYAWSVLNPLQPVNTPIPVTLTAWTSSLGPATNFTGTLRLSATNALGQPVAISPTEAHFEQGQWQGAVTILAAADGVVLLAEDDIGLGGQSTAFSANANDFGVFISDTPDPVSINQTLTYSVSVVNTGPGEATGVWITNTLPAEVDLVDVTPSQGSCRQDGGRIICDLGTIARSGIANVAIRLVPAVPGMLTNRVSAVRNESDPHPANNAAVAETVVTMPPLVIDDASMAEGDTGTQTLSFTVRLLFPTTNTVTARYATANGSADPRDFAPTSGTVTFPPNVTTQTVAVTIKNDTRFEADETFFVNLSNPLNALLGQAQAVGAILNNDPPPIVTLTDASVTEGDGGTNTMTFSFQLSAVSGLPVQVKYATRPGTASADSDYIPKVGEVVFLANFPALTRNVTIQIPGDTEAETNEEFYVEILEAANGAIGTARATGTIIDNDIQFVWEPLPDLLPINTPLPVTLTARFFDQTIDTGFNGNVTLEAFVASPLVPGNMLGDLAPLDGGPGDFTIGYDFTLTENVRVTHIRHYTGTKVSVWDRGGRLVISQNVVSEQGTWRETPLRTPVWLQAGQTYRIAYYTGGANNNLYVTLGPPPQFPQGVIQTNQWFAIGEDYPTIEIPAEAFYGFVDLAFEAGQPPVPIQMTPPVAGPFVNGAWSGELTLLQSGANVTLHATDVTGHFGQSPPLHVVEALGSDLDVAMFVSANPAPAGSRVVFKLFVANFGPAAATNVFLTNFPPAELTLVSAWSSQGALRTNAAGALVFDLGALASGDAAFITCDFLANQDGMFTNTAVAVSALADPEPLNNTAQIVLAVCADCDQDGMSDAWERLFGLDPRDSADALLDPDGDGLTNFEEFINGTNPFASDVPIILVQPEDQFADSGGTATFTVEAEGTEPLSYQWFHYGNFIQDATNATLTVTNAQLDAGGEYFVVVANPFRSTQSEVARLVLDPDQIFRIIDLTTNDVLAIDVDNLIGDDRGGIAVSSNRVFLTGDNDTGLWNAQNLTGGLGIGTRYDSLVSDLRTETIYTLALDNTPVNSGGSINALIQIDELTGNLTTNRINLSTNIDVFGTAGIFAGYGRIVLYSGDGRVYHIALPSGTVSQLTEFFFMNFRFTENWAFWGIAEYFDGSIHLVYRGGSGDQIVRTRVPDRTTTTVSQFQNLSDMASITLSPSLSRWFFHHEGGSQFFSGSEALGSARAVFTTDPEFPSVRRHPVDTVSYPGSNATFRVVASGGEPLSYQWLFEGNPIPEATSAVLTLANLQPGDAGQYRVVVSNALGQVVSTDATLTIYDQPIILRDIFDREVNPGTDVAFFVQADGAPPLAYQWRFNLRPIPGATNDVLLLRDVEPTNSGNYSLVISNAFGSLITAAALKVFGAPVILQPPQSQFTAEGSVARFRVEVEGAPPLAYQWLYAGTAIPNATNAVLDLLGVTFTNAGLYAVTISNTYGAVVSAEAELTVVDAGQFVDDFEPDIDLIQWLEFGGTVGESVIATNYGGSVSGENSLWFGGDEQRYATTRALNTVNGGTIIFWVHMGDSSFPWEDPDSGEDIVLEYSVDAGGSWETIATAEVDSFTDWRNFTEPIPLGAQSETTLFRWRQLRHSGDCCDHWALDDVSIITGPTPPTIFTQPADQTVAPGRTATLNVAVSGSLPLYFQWQFNGADLPGATNATLVISNMQPANVGTYSVSITNIYGSVHSADASLQLPFDDLTRFRIVQLTDQNSVVVNHNDQTGDDRGGIAASASQVFVTGDNSTARLALADLSGATSLGVVRDGLIADLRRQKVYLLANGSTPIASSGNQTVTTLLELDDDTGELTGRSINLSMPIEANTFNGEPGLFSGYGRAVIHNGSQVYSIQLPSGFVTDLGPMDPFTHQTTENWAFWGVAEHDATATYLVYVDSDPADTIVRRRVPDGFVEIISTFDNLGDMGSITVSIPWNRWYFHYESFSQFGSRTEAVGYANAQFSVDTGIYPARFDWGAINALQPVGVPIPVTLSAMSVAAGVSTNYHGVVTLSAQTAGGQNVLIEPTVVSNFVRGTWTGAITVLEPAANISLVAEDADGLTGRSAAFEASTNDFGVFMSASPDPVITGQELTYAIQVLNAGPGEATGVQLTNTLPAAASLLRVSPSQGACTNLGGLVLCDLGTLGVASKALVEIVVRPETLQSLTNQVRVSRNEADPNLANNAAEIITTVSSPPLVIDDAQVPEGDGGNQTASFTVRLLAPSTNTISVTCAAVFDGAAPNPAFPSRDFLPVTTTLTFPPNVLTQHFDVTIRGDTRFEVSETFLVNLSNPTHARLERAQAVGTILDDDTAPVATIQDVSLVEQDSGTNEMVFQVELSDFSGANVTVHYATSNVTATAGFDYQERVGTVEFRKDFQRFQNIRIPILGDTLAEADETFELHLTAADNTTIGTPLAIGTIEDDDFQFVFSPLAAVQPVNAAIPLTIDAQYFDGTPATQFSDSVNLSAINLVRETNTVGTGNNTLNRPLGVGNRSRRTQCLYLASEIGQAGPITSLALNVSTVPGQTLNNWTIRMKHTSLSAYGSSADRRWINTDWTTVYQANETINALGWHTFVLNRPFAYNGTDNLMVEFTFNNNATGSDGRCRATSQSDTRTIYYFTSSAAGDPLTWEGTQPGVFSSSLTPNLRLGFTLPIPVLMTPAVTPAFTNGTWSGTVTLLRAETNVQLHALAPSGHQGVSDTFDAEVITQADLALRLTAPTNAVWIGSNLTFRLTATNQGPSSAPFVTITNPLPPGLSFVQAGASQGSVTNFSDHVRFALGTLRAGAGAQLSVTLRADSAGFTTNQAVVRSNVEDPNLTNNLAGLILEVVCTDCDQDGLPDDWENANGLNPNDPADALADADNDGFKNFEEYWAGTDPRDATDRLTLDIGQPEPGTGNVPISFIGKTGRKYVVERATLMSGPWIPVAAFKVGMVTNITFTDFGPTGQGMSLYRVRYVP